MVVRVGRALIVLILALFPLAASCAQLPIRLRVEPGPLEYGKAIYLALSAYALHPQLSTLNLSPLNKDFVVVTSDSAVLDGQSRRQLWRIVLYPRRSGRLQIPSLVFAGHKTQSRLLVIKPAVDSSSGAPIRVHSQVSGTSVWVNEAVHVTLRVDSASSYAWLASPSVQEPGIDIVSLPATRRTSGRAGHGHTIHQIAWVLYPQTVGAVTVQLPQVEYHHDGLITHRFYPPKLVLHVHALPAFVPPTLPIGRMQVRVSLPHHWFLFNHHLSFLTLHVRGEGLPGQRPSGILRQLKSNSAVSFYSPRELAEDHISPTSKGSEVSYQVPFRAKAMGWIALPSLRLQYFNPVTGKIETHTQALGRIAVIDPWALYAGMAVLLLIGYRAGRSAWQQGKRRYQSYYAYRTALRMLQQAGSPIAIKLGVMEIAKGESWSGNITLANWLKLWSARYPHLSGASTSVRGLQKWLYGKHPERLENIRPGLIDVCYRRMPLLRVEAVFLWLNRRDHRDRV